MDERERYGQGMKVRRAVLGGVKFGRDLDCRERREV
jgi:hypothetical protein